MKLWVNKSHLSTLKGYSDLNISWDKFKKIKSKDKIYDESPVIKKNPLIENNDQSNNNKICKISINIYLGQDTNVIETELHNISTERNGKNIIPKILKGKSLKQNVSPEKSAKLKMRMKSKKEFFLNKNELSNKKNR